MAEHADLECWGGFGMPSGDRGGRGVLSQDRQEEWSSARRGQGSPDSRSGFLGGVALKSMQKESSNGDSDSKGRLGAYPFLWFPRLSWWSLESL